ncbi:MULTISPECIES: HAD family hydrolase [unclassified Pseudarthrobacter]|uniref:HAD family hydrolase n=1 Tax=unclassified Pseudarthrobacter TaxID=2647000 RepID=UPI0030775C92
MLTDHPREKDPPRSQGLSLPGPQPSGQAKGWVLFDVGGVLIEKPMDFEEMARIAGTPGGEEFRNVFSRHRDVYDAGGRAPEFWASVVIDLGQFSPRPETIERLIATECRRWAAPSEDIVTYINHLQHAGYKLAILSNAPFELAGAMRTSELGKSFDSMTFSCEIGSCKPHPEAHRAALSALGACPTTIKFFDDRKENC